MPSKNIFKFLILFVGIFLIGWAYIFSSDEWSLRVLTGTWWRFMATGSFQSDYGNFWAISFDEEPDGANKAHMNWATMSGYFWTQSAGWMYFTGASISPADTWSWVRERWTATGYIWSDYAGYTELIDVSYFPDTATLTGWAWSDTLWWLSLENVVDNVWLWFIWRVKIVGNIGSKSIYDVNLDWYDQQWVYAIGTVADVINDVKKKIGVRMRNAENYISFSNNGELFTDHSKEPLDSILYYNYTGSAQPPYIQYNDVANNFDNANVRTLVVIWGDIYIDTGVILPNNALPHAIIALKNLNWIGWNIYINSTVTKIQSTLMAEGTIYSAKRTWSDWYLFNADKIWTAWLPNYQLYIKWSVISRNTIWGAWVLWDSKCPFTETDCSYDQALRYDFNYFRDFQTGALDPSTGDPFAPDELSRRRGYTDTTYDDKSLIIQYDPRIVSDPPPGL